MTDEQKILPINFFTSGGCYTGNEGKLRYRIERIGEKPDFQLKVSVWEGPNASDKVPAEAMRSECFSLNSDGRKEAVHWIQRQCANWESAE